MTVIWWMVLLGKGGGNRYCKGVKDMGNHFSYERISTKEERQKQKYSRQDAALGRYASENNIEFIYQAKEDKSGKDFENRKEWLKIEKLVQPGDTIVFKDISRFTRNSDEGYQKYMELLNKGVELIFIDNPTVCTPYIKKMMQIAEQQSLVVRTTLESTIKLLLIVELDRVEQERLVMIQRVKDGIKASPKKSGRPAGKVYKLDDGLKEDIQKYLSDRSVKQVDLMKKYKISRNTLKKYIAMVSGADNGDGIK